ncbi:hypothetical protein R3P38DRAFT_2850653 [Favolaschia claudopus]|uniref:Uncharacterized protein n=1 Tax=Favolaschia claudopus TaxID=2862362 RepID=A0AAW0DQV4_9AGAR
MSLSCCRSCMIFFLLFLLLLLQHVNSALTFGPLDDLVIPGRPLRVTWTSDPAVDPSIWVLEVASNRSGDSKATVDKVDGSAGQFSFVFPEVGSASAARFRQQAFVLRAVSFGGGQLLATSEPFRLDRSTAAAPGATPSSVDAASFTPLPSPLIPSTTDSITSQPSPPPPPPGSEYASSHPSSNSTSTSDLGTNPDNFARLPALIAGPILAVGTAAFLGFLIWTCCGCRKRPDADVLDRAEKGKGKV